MTHPVLIQPEDGAVTPLTIRNPGVAIVPITENTTVVGSHVSALIFNHHLLYEISP